MSSIQILDCTLRDGGYVNNWKFGNKTIKNIIKRLSEAKVDIIECGFLSEAEYNSDMTVFSSVSQIKELLPKDCSSRCVAMVALGEKEIAYDKISDSEGNSLFGIRLTFHKHEIERAFEYAKVLMNKGYEVFIQPVGTCTYTDRELIELIEKVNILQPYAFYIVDTLGTINGTELMRLFQLVDNNLNHGIKVGFHSHNNLQLAFANAQELVRFFTEREIIIDASVLGMGRGAGNLCTELITQYMNEKLKTHYNVTALLEIVDNYLMQVKEKYPWGYTIPYYIAAINKCHPNYATYLMNRQTITVKDIEKIIESIPKDRRALYDKNYIEAVYNHFQKHDIDDAETIHKLRQLWNERKILVLAPGKSLVNEQEKIEAYITKYSPYIISVNFCSEIYHENMVFVSNLKRFEHLDDLYVNNKVKNILVTSNIDVHQQENIFKVNYSSYLNGEQMISDNAGLMLCLLLLKCGVKEIALAGFDGFASNSQNNYFNEKLINNVEKEEAEIKTQKIREQIYALQQHMKIEFVTESLYEGVDKR